MNNQERLREKDRAYMKFEMEEAKWLDSVVRPYLPKFLVWFVEKGGRTAGLKRLAGLAHFIVDYFFIAKWLKIEIVRNQDTSLLSGKGYRPGYERQRLDRVRTTVFKGRGKKKKEIAKEAFPIGIIIN